MNLSAVIAEPSQSGDVMWPADRTILLLMSVAILKNDELLGVVGRIAGILKTWLSENGTISSPLPNVCFAP
jgi:hypothetical protein